MSGPTTPLVRVPKVWALPRSLAATWGISLISLPLITEMFHFIRFAFISYVFTYKFRPKAEGSPIRISPGQSLLTTHRSFSQSATSFFAS